jgi:very-short-patch-repair endonuclease
LLDISELLPIREVERALDEALARKLVTLDVLRGLLGRTRNRHGLTILRRLIAWRTTSAGGRTKWQRMAYKAFVLAGLPEPEQDVWYLGYQHDFLWRTHGVTLEVDGYPWHSTKTNMERDRAKETTCKQHGLHPSRVSNGQVESNILQVVALVAARLALRDPASRGSAAASAAPAQPAWQRPLALPG